MQVTSAMKKKITVAHSPDADDAFMFYALTGNLIKSDFLEFSHELKDIQTLNVESNIVKYDVQAISFFAYPEVADKYQLLSCGGSVGYGYGPMLVSKKYNIKDDLQALKTGVIAVPGEKTTAFLLLKLLLKDFKYICVPFDTVIGAVINGKCDFGLIIHEGQLSYIRHGLNKIVDLGEWWLGKTNLPVPLGGNIVKRSFNESEKKEINLCIKKSIIYGIENKDKVIPAVSKYARELKSNHELTGKFVSMYVNDFTVDYGVSGKLAIKKLFQLAFEQSLIKQVPKLDFVE